MSVHIVAAKLTEAARRIDADGDEFGAVSIMRNAAELIGELAAEAAQLRRENDFLRAYTGNSDKACAYCGLGSEEQGKCASGFPGCARGDDQMLCREAAVGMERDQLREQLAGFERKFGKLVP